MPTDIRFDDIEKLRAKVSTEFGPWSKPIEVTQEKINRFADVTGDHPERGLDHAEADPGDGFGVGLAGEQVFGGDGLAERGAGESVVVAQVDHVSPPGRVMLAARAAAVSAAARAPAAACRAVAMSWLDWPLTARSAAMRSSRSALAVR